MQIIRYFTLALCLVVSFPVLAGELQISQAWTRAMLPGAKVAAGFVTITNSGRAAERLVSASSPIAAKVELHSMAVVDGVMTMRPIVGGVSVPAGGTVELKPGGDHLMLMGVSTPLKEGDRVPVTLVFENGEEASVELMVMPAGAKVMKHNHG